MAVRPDPWPTVLASSEVLDVGLPNYPHKLHPDVSQTVRELENVCFNKSLYSRGFESC